MKCLECHTDFDQKVEWQKFCTKTCHDNWWTKTRRMIAALRESGVLEKVMK